MERRRPPRAPLPRRSAPMHAACALAAVALLAFAATARASIDPGTRTRMLRPRLVAPAAGERLAETAARFAFETGRGASHPVIVLSRQAFDPSGWTAIPADERLIVRDASTPVLSLAQAGVTIDAETPLWWALATRDDATGALIVSEVRSFVALPRFANRVAPSPYLPPARLGRLEASDVLGSRALRANAGGASATATVAPRIRLGAGYDFAPADGEPLVPRELSSAAAPRDESDPMALRSYLVQFDTPPGADEIAAITQAGGAMFAYIPDQAYLVRMSASARATFANGARAAWIGDFQPAFKLSPDADRSAPAGTAFAALLFPDADPARVRSGLAAAGASEMDESDNGINKLLRFRAAGGALAAIAALSEVAWIEPVPHMEFFNDLDQWVVQTGVLNSRRVWDMGIRGQGQVVETTDSGILTTHNMFFDAAHPIGGFGDYVDHRKIIAYQKGSTSSLVEFGDHSTASWHGTHTGGTIAGLDDPNGVSTRDGMAKEARIYFMDIGGSGLGTSLDTFADLNDLFLPGYVGNAAGAARICSNSWGGGSPGAYSLNSMEVDQFMWNHPDYFIAFANGNAGPSIKSVASPATAKNCASIGGVRNGLADTLIYTSSSRGPTSDNRRKPTFCAPAQSVTSSVGPTSASYATYNGTSMATPSSAGAVALMRQYLTDGWYPTGAAVANNGFSPSAALLKAMAVNSSDNRVPAFTAPDNNIGWGRLTADNVLYFAGDAKKLLLVDNTGGLENAQYIEYQVNVVDGAAPLEVTLCWTDYPGSPAAAVQIVNNLNLTVSKGATVYKGNRYSGGVSVTGGLADSLNVEEAVLVAAPATGIWTVRVDAPAVPVGPQPFGLCITGGVGNGAGALALDRGVYGSTSTVELQVIDSNAGPSVTVDVTSTTEGSGETVTLTTPGSGIYSGTLTLSPLLSGNHDGTLTVSQGDALTATYGDASPVTTLIASASVDFDTPAITNVHATSQGGGSTLVNWTTDRNASSRVWYGVTPALELGFADSAGAVTQHKVLLNGIATGQSYYYDVESVTLAGSAARDSLGGSHYRFTGEGSADILLVLGDATFERTQTWASALVSNGLDYDVWSGSLADHPPLGGLATGMRSYKAVLWQCGFTDYPPFSDEQRDTITSYLSGGGRLATVGHDMGWGLADPSSPGYSAARAAWLASTLHAQFLSDPATWTTQTGIASDPISGAYTGGVAYEPIGSGQAGDEVAVSGGGGTGNYIWRNDDVSPDNDAFRWENSSPNGSGSTAFWGGLPSRIVNMFFEFTALRPPFTSADAIRNDILNQTVNWLLGRPRPTVSLTAPNGGENLAGASTNVTWTESVGPGRAVASRRIEYSLDGGDSWTLITAAAGASPYSWDLTSVPNSSGVLVRIRLTDDGTPALGAADQSATTFVVNHSGGDSQGPVVVTGTIESAPNPIVRGSAATLTARASDQLTGGGTIDAAEWSYGTSPAAAGNGHAMSGAFGTSTVNVSGAVDTSPFFTGIRKLWVRAHDTAGNWGAASALTLRINGTDPVAVGDTPDVAFLAQNSPNPFFRGVTTIRFGLATPGAVELAIFDAQGRRVRDLVRGALPAGNHLATWNGADDRGARVRAGVYYYRLITPAGRFERRLVALE